MAAAANAELRVAFNVDFAANSEFARQRGARAADSLEAFLEAGIRSRKVLAACCETARPGRAADL